MTINRLEKKGGDYIMSQERVNFILGERIMPVLLGLVIIIAFFI